MLLKNSSSNPIIGSSLNLSYNFFNIASNSFPFAIDSDKLWDNLNILYWLEGG